MSAICLDCPVTLKSVRSPAGVLVVALDVRGEQSRIAIELDGNAFNERPLLYWLVCFAVKRDKKKSFTLSRTILVADNPLAPSPRIASSASVKSPVDIPFK